MSKRTQPRTAAEKIADIEEQLRSVRTAVLTGVVAGDHSLLANLDADDHPQYQLRSEQGAAGGYPSLEDPGGTVPKAQLPADIVYGDGLDDLGLLVWLTMTEA